jgi:hypothetical protein
MGESLSKFNQAQNRFFAAIRAELVEDVRSLPDEWQRTFRLMYGRKNGKRSAADAETMSVAEVVAEIPTDKLDWAVQQVENSHRKLAPPEQPHD